MPVVGVGDMIPRPIRRLVVLEDDPRFPVLVRRVAPDIEIPPATAPWTSPGALEPGVLVGCVIDYELRDNA